MEEGANGRDFLPLSECHAALIDAYPWDASEKLLSALRDGEIRAVADQWSVFCGSEILTPDGRDVPLWVWRDAAKANVDFLASALEANQQGGNRRVKLRGIKCDATAFRAIFGEALAVSAANGHQFEVNRPAASALNGKPASDKGGAPTDAVKWSNLVAVVGAIFANADLVPGGGPPKRSTLRSMIDDYAARIGLPIASRNTIDPAIDLLIRIAWAEHDNGRPLLGADGQSLKNDQ